MTTEQRNKLAGLLCELSTEEIHPELNRFIDKLDAEKARDMQNIEQAIDVILEYIGR